MNAITCLALELIVLHALIGAVAAQPSTPVSASRPEPAGPAPSPIPGGALGTNFTGKSNYPVIGFLEGRGKVIIIKSGPKGPLYSVRDASGKTLFEDLSTDQLRAKARDVHDFIKSAFAVNTRIDASLRSEPIR